MQLDLDDTIAAIASAPGSAARGIIRISGPETSRLLTALFAPDEPDGWGSCRRPHVLSGRIRHQTDRLDLPAQLYLWPNRRSYTGQPAAELHTIGSPPLLELVLTEIVSHGARIARPGEFTLRAFLAGRLDLVQAEAVLGVIDAHDQRQLRTALDQLAGGVSSQLAAIRNDLLNLLADLEAGLDFADEDIEFIGQQQLLLRIDSAQQQLAVLADESERRMTSPAQARIVLAGLPNAGKSTLFNALCGRPAALVSPERGTTRDYLSAAWAGLGTPAELVDTAGWETSTDFTPMHTAGRLREAQLQDAEVILWCTASDLAAGDEPLNRQRLAELEASAVPVVRLRTKSDLRQVEPAAPVDNSSADPQPRVDNTRSPAMDRGEIEVSVLFGTGLEQLRNRVAELLGDRNQPGRQWIGATAARCRESLQLAQQSLQIARSDAERNSGAEIVAVSLSDALDQLGQVVGAVYTNDLLDRIFSRFCIGK